MFTKMFYDKLNEMSESHLEGAFRQEEILNDIVSSVNPKLKSYRKWALSLNKTFDDIEISSVKKMSRITKRHYAYTPCTKTLSKERSLYLKGSMLMQWKK